MFAAAAAAAADASKLTTLASEVEHASENTSKSKSASSRTVGVYITRRGVPGSPPACWLREPQPKSTDGSGGFPRHAERYRLGGPTFSSPTCWRVVDEWKDF